MNITKHGHFLQDLKEVFEKYGEVGDVFIPSDRETGRTRGFAFVRFYDKKDAEVIISTARTATSQNFIAVTEVVSAVTVAV